ncbi:MAG: hypothetical protein HFP77_05410 [Methylococcales symbiont of Iophon sp. n. MRB-2018]|nr:MAG: hypothetical protein HFP77_05410 [Methylococcales symbiont of Iophon sp. n. MRB-2018]KAF3979838.1 MAG: hypothetical protein HFP76_04960 [Methylococcales symbiont of Iophon sp. n. MRB-2018]
MMRAYAAACGRESAAAESEGREFNINTALITLLGMVNPKISTDHELLIEREFERCNNFYDKPLITSHLINQMKVDESKVSDILKLARKSLNPDDKGLMVRMVIASIIEEQFSKEDRGEYMLQVFLGKAS